jgi:putative endonuclease
MEGYVYLLKSYYHDWHYIGSTKELKKRFHDHNQGRVRSSKFYKPFKLIYYEAYLTYSLARKREIKLKRNQKEKEDLFRRLKT